MSEAPSFSIGDANVDDLDAILAAEASESGQRIARVDLACVRFTPELLEHIPREVAEQYGVLPVYARRARLQKKRVVEPGVLYIATASPTDAAILEDCSLCCGMPVRAFLADAGEIRRAITVVYEGGQVEHPVPVSTTAPKPPPVPSRNPLKNVTTLPSATSFSTPPSKPAASEGAAADGAPQRQPSMPELPLVKPVSTAAVSSAPSGAAPQVTPAGSPKTLPPDAFSLDEALADGEGASHGSLISIPPPMSRPPRLLALSASESMMAYCREALEPLGGVVEACDMSRTGELSASERPRLLLVPEEVYPFDRRAFNLLAFELGVPLVVWSLDMDPADLQSLLLASGPRSQPPLS